MGKKYLSLYRRGIKLRTGLWGGAFFAVTCLGAALNRFWIKYLPADQAEVVSVLCGMLLLMYATFVAMFFLPIWDLSDELGVGDDQIENPPRGGSGDQLK